MMTKLKSKRKIATARGNEMKEWRRKKAKKNNNKCTICFSTFHLALKCKETKKTHTPRFNAMFFFLSLGSFLVVFVTRVNYGDDVWFDALHIFMLGFARIENIICHRMLPKEIRDFKICIWFFFCFSWIFNEWNEGDAKNGVSCVSTSPMTSKRIKRTNVDENR